MSIDRIKLQGLEFVVDGKARGGVAYAIPDVLLPPQPPITEGDLKGWRKAQQERAREYFRRARAYADALEKITEESTTP